MIDVKELRVGNYVLDRVGKIIRIDFFEYLRDGYDCKFGQLNYFNDIEMHALTEYSNYANPIPLTEDILLKCGFIQSSNIFTYKSFVLEIYDETQKAIWWRDRYLGICQRLGGLHQLQNLYFSLTGQELQVNL